MKFIDDGYADNDLIGYDAARRSVVELVSSIEVKQASGSFTIGVFGDWGTGKTSMLRQIQSSLNEEMHETFTIWFNPWQFPRQTSIVLAFFKSLAMEFNGVVLKKRSLPKKIADSVGAIASTFQESVDRLASSVKVGLTPTGDWTFQLAEGTGTTKPNRGPLEYFEAADLITMLQTLSKNLSTVKIAVFIDDLDRCAPDTAIDLLDGIKVLLDLPNFVFLIGASKRIVEKAVKHRYNNFYDKESTDLSDMNVDYLDKLVQFEFLLPTPDRKKTLTNLVIPFLASLELDANYGDMIVDSVPDFNPRTIKRLFNVIQFSIITGRNKLGNDLDIGLALRSAILKDRHKLVASFFMNNPSDLLKVQSNLTDESIEDAGSHIDALLTPMSEIKANDLRKLIDDKMAPVIVDILRIGGDRMQFENRSAVVDYLSFAEQSTTTIELPQHRNTVQAFTHNQSSVPSSEELLLEQLVEVKRGPLTQGNEKSGFRNIEISKNFLIGKFEVTHSLFFETIGQTFEKSLSNFPVTRVTWWEAVKFCNALSKKIGLSEVYDFSGESVRFDLEKNGFRLPTEAEWELAFSQAVKNNSLEELEKFAWHSNNSDYELHEIGELDPIGELHDMLGNVWEWCNDWYHPYSDEMPIGPEFGSHKVCKGGSYTNFENILSPYYRGKETPSTSKPNVGFRLARTV